MDLEELRQYMLGKPGQWRIDRLTQIFQFTK